MRKCNVQHSSIPPWKFPRAAETPAQAARLAAMETASAGTAAVPFQCRAGTLRASAPFCQRPTAPLQPVPPAGWAQRAQAPGTGGNGTGTAGGVSPALTEVSPGLRQLDP